MILEKQKENLELTDGEIHESYATVIDFDSAEFLKQMLSKFYSDAVGSLIRETASNALDSHREINSSEPIIVSLGVNAEGNWEYSVEDFGVGIDKDTINNILRKYGKSTKRHSVNQLGAYGLGWKSPLAYSSSFYFIGRKNGVEVKCMMYEGEEDIKIDILSEQPTEERNGCKVIVPVKHKDKTEFRNKIDQQLAYFENVYFNVDYCNNAFKIHREKDFQYSELVTDNYLHICLDNVYYPLDFSKLGINAIPVSLGLRFSLTDGIFPTPNREAIKYSPEAKEIILDKIKKVADWLINKYDESVVDTDNIEYIFDHFDYSHRFVFVTDTLKVEISKLVPFSTNKALKTPTLKGLKRLSTEKIVELRPYLLIEFDKEYYLHNGKISQEKHWKEVRSSDLLKRSQNVYVFSDRLTSIKKEYIKFLEKNAHKHTKIYFLKKRKYFSLWNKEGINSLFNTFEGNNTFYKILNLRNVPRQHWREYIEDFYYVRDLITVPNLIDIDKMVIPTAYLDSRKQKQVTNKIARAKKQVGEISVKVCTQLHNHSYTKYSKLVPNTMKVDELYKTARFVVYGSTGDADKMDKLFGAYKGHTVSFIVLSDREINRIKDVKIHNLMSVEEFMKGDNMIYKRIVTSHLIHRLHKNYKALFSRASMLDIVSKKLVKDLEALDEYRRKYYSPGNLEFNNEMIKFAEENRKVDESIYSEYKRISATLDSLYFIEEFVSRMVVYYSMQNKKSIVVRTLVDLFKYHKQKVNLEHYTCSTAEDVEEEN